VIRIGGGLWRGRRLRVPPHARPSTGLVRKAAFDILGADIEGARVLDAAAGSGAYGLEAISRGASAATFVESEPSAVAVLRRNVEDLGAGSRSSIEATRVADFCTRRKRSGRGGFDVIFFDPPFGGEWEADLPALLELRMYGGVLLLECGRESAPLAVPEPSETRRYGSARLLVFRAPRS